MVGQGRPQPPVPGHEDQEDQQPDNNLQQARPFGLLHTVERQVLHRLEFWRIFEALKSNHIFNHLYSISSQSYLVFASFDLCIFPTDALPLFCDSILGGRCDLCCFHLDTVHLLQFIGSFVL